MMRVVIHDVSERLAQAFDEENLPGLMTDLPQYLAYLLETTAALESRLSANDFDPASIYVWLPLVEEVIAAWCEVHDRLEEAPDGVATLYRIASAIRYGDQPPTRELARLLGSIPSSEFDIE
jgi:hypothetical protein